MSFVAARVFGSSAVRRSFESCIRSLLKLCRAWDYCGFRDFPTLSGAQSELVSELNPTYTLVTHHKSCALRQSNRPFAFYVCVIVVFTFGVYGAAEKLRPLGSWYSTGWQGLTGKERSFQSSWLHFGAPDGRGVRSHESKAGKNLWPEVARQDWITGRSTLVTIAGRSADVPWLGIPR
ncbi:hypothetical protein QBC45DRAFT_97578 [Copromyces sp. CBS 386.78]|nr:hypothetical protein QBC45DRAFT_97578 [Copromyces sp. CBS 386.78]